MPPHNIAHAYFHKLVKRRVCWCIAGALLLTLFSACTADGAADELPSASPETSMSAVEQQPLVENFPDEAESLFSIEGSIALASTGKIELADGTPVYVYLELVSGHYQPERVWSHFDRCWMGEFQLALYSWYNRNTTPIATLPIDCRGFEHFFDILVDDYNGDGNPDFTINVETANSSGSYYRIYTITAEQTIEEIDMGGETLVNAHHAPSIRLFHEDGVISIYYIIDGRYAELDDPKDRQARMIHYQWDGEKFANIGRERLDMPIEEGNAYIRKLTEEMLQ